jgi:hypothetical protein
MELFHKLLPLAQESWNESSRAKAETCAFYGKRDLKIEPDADQYQRLDSLGILLLLTLRDGNDVVGYLLAVTHPALHHKQIICANVDCVYVDPDYRSYTGVMIERFEKEATDRGAQIIGWPTHPNGPVYEVLTAMGYVGDDLVMEKQLIQSMKQ